MFNLFGRKHDQLIIDNGRVFCPIRQQDTDIDICAACHRIREMDTTAEPGFVRCQLETAKLPNAYCA